jgi:hypothetical protein
MQEEIDSLLVYSNCTDEGNIYLLHGYKNIHVHFVFAVKHCLHSKERKKQWNKKIRHVKKETKKRIIDQERNDVKS